MSDLTRRTRGAHTLSPVGTPASRRGALFLTVLAALLALLTFAVAGADAPVTRVIWAQGPTAYLAPADSSALRAGDHVWFVQNGEPLASALVTRVDRDGLALATLDSGTLVNAKHLDRLEVQVTHAIVRRPSRLVIGCASPWRLATAQPKLPALAARIPTGYRLEPPATSGGRLVRDSSVAASTWPETLLVRWFEFAVDEEIALERGEIDLGLFAPGELSAAMREQPRWQGFRSGTRTRDALAWISADATPLTAHVPMRSDNSLANRWAREAYRGDLSALTPDAMPVGDSTAVPMIWRADTSVARTYREGVRFEPPANWIRRPGTPPMSPRFLSAPVAAFDSLALALALQMRGQEFAACTSASADSVAHAILDPSADAPPVSTWNRYVALHRSLGLIRLDALRCPVLCSRELRPFVDTLDADALADLIGRLPGGPAR